MDIRLSDYSTVYYKFHLKYDHLFRKRLEPSSNLVQISFESSLRVPKFKISEVNIDKSPFMSMTESIKSNNL